MAVSLVAEVDWLGWSELWMLQETVRSASCLTKHEDLALSVAFCYAEA